MADSMRQIHSTVEGDGTLKLSLETVPVPEPAADEVLVRVEASPINPSDLGLLFGGADMTTARAGTMAADKLRVLRAAAASHHFTTAQVRRLVKRLAFGADRVEAIALLKPRLVDPERFHTLYALLPHASDREALEARLAE